MDQPEQQQLIYFGRLLDRFGSLVLLRLLRLRLLRSIVHAFVHAQKRRSVRHSADAMHSASFLPM